MRRHLSIQRHVSHALGYVGLEMFKEAAAELELIEEADRSRPEVQAVRVELHMGAKQWDLVIDVASRLVRTHPEIEHAWIGWAYALRELKRVLDARTVLLEAESRHGKTSAVLHYNLACYESLLGDVASARSRLATACRMDERLKSDGAVDPDLQALRDARQRRR